MMNKEFNTELFREKLKVLKQKGFSRPDKEVASRSGISISVIQKLRAGVYSSKLQLDTEKAIAKAIGVARKKLFLAAS